MCIYLLMMKRLLVTILFMCLSCSAFAARAGLKTISNDPYTSAIVVDVSTGDVIFEEGADKTVYPASVVKLMDLLLILERVEAGKLKMSDWVHVTAEASRIGGSQVYLKEGETFAVEEMLYALSIKSANDVATAMAINIAGTTDNFVKLMNQRAEELKMTSTKFVSVHGLPPTSGQEPDVTTARDIAKLSMEIVKHPEALRFTSTKEKWFRNNTFEMLSHNRLLLDVEGCDGLKTGYYTAAGFSISATAKRNDRRVIAVVMGCKSRQVRDDKARELLGYGFLHLPEIKIPEPVEPEPEVAVVEEAKPRGMPFVAAIKKLIKFIGKLLLVLALIALSGGVLFGLFFFIKQRRENWKYKF